MSTIRQKIFRGTSTVAGGLLGAGFGQGINKGLAVIASNPTYVKTGEHVLGPGNINEGQVVDTITNTHAHLQHLMEQGYDTPMKLMFGALGGAVGYTVARSTAKKSGQQSASERKAHFAEGVNNSRD